MWQRLEHPSAPPNSPVNLLDFLPDHLLARVYLYDPTYRDAFDIVMEELRFKRRQDEQLTEILCDMELEGNMFETSAHLLLHSVLGNNYRDDVR